MKRALKPSIGQRKLKSLGIDLPFFPMTLAGSLPKHDELKEMRYKVSKGVQPESELQRKEPMSTDLWIREQDRAALDVLVDGGMYMDDMISHYAARVEGFERGELVRCYGNRYYRRPIVKRNVAWKSPLISDRWPAIQRVSKRPMKAIVTGPFTLMDWSFNEHYPSRKALVEDLTVIIKKEIKDLVDAGAKIIQIDEPAFTAREEDYLIFANALKELTKNHKAYFILHHAFGDIAPFWKKIQALPVDQISIEGIHPNAPLFKMIKQTPSTKDIAVAVVEAHNHDVEMARDVMDRMRAALKFIPPERLWWSSDSSLQTRTPEQTTGKIKVLAEAVKKMRALI